MRRVGAFFLLLSLSGAAYADVDTDELAAPGRAIDAAPDSADAYDAYAQAAFRMKRWDDAIMRLKLGVARIPGYHAGWYKLAYAYRQKHAFTEAAAAYRKFGELEPSRADTYFGLGAALQGAGDRAGAVAAYQRYVSLEKAADKQKFVTQAQAEIARLATAAAPPSQTPPPTVATTPPVAKNGNAPPAANAVALRTQAERLRQAGKLDEAATAYEAAVAADPGNVDVYIELGDVYFSQRRYKDAARVFHATIERDAGYALGWYNLAHAQSRDNDHAGAVRSYREYIRLRPSDPDPYYGLGLSLKAAGDSKGAIEALHTYLNMERRPESQRWLDRARHELEALEGTPHANMSDLKNPFEQHARRDLKNPFQDHDAYASDEFLPPGESARPRDARADRISAELARDDILPIIISGDSDNDVVPDDTSPTTSRERLARYANALAAYRIALEHQASEVAAVYQHGVDRVLANDLRGAQRAWTVSVESDRALSEARARLDRARSTLTGGDASPPKPSKPPAK